MAAKKAAELKKLKERLFKARDFQKQSILRTEKTVSDKEKCESWSQSEIQVRLELIESAYTKYEDACVNLCSEIQLDTDEANEMQGDNDETQTLMLTTKATLHAQLKHLNEEAIAREQKSKSENTPMQIVDEQTQPEPEFECGQFSGKMDEWFSFREEFEKATAKIPRMSQGDKYDQLKARCEGKAKLVISQVGGSEFDQAMKKLSDIFGSTYMQLQCHLNKLLEIPNMENASRTAIEAMLTEAKQCEAGFEKVNYFAEFDATLTLVIISKLDEETKKAWKRQQTVLANSWVLASAEGEPTRELVNYMPPWEQLKKFLESELLIYAFDISEGASCSTNWPTRSQAKFTTMQALAVAKLEAPIFLQCILCDGIHPKYKCTVFIEMNFAARWAHVRAEKLCEKCLRPAHQGKCVAPGCNKPCPHCMPSVVYHNSLLCGRKDEQMQGQSSGNAASNKGNEENWDN